MKTAIVQVCPLTVAAWRLGALSLTDLWWRYVGLGGNADRSALADYLDGSATWPSREHNILAAALNERLWDVGVASLAPVRPSV